MGTAEQQVPSMTLVQISGVLNNFCRKTPRYLSAISNTVRVLERRKQHVSFLPTATFSFGFYYQASLIKMSQE